MLDPSDPTFNFRIDEYEKFEEFVKYIKNKVVYVDAPVNVINVDAYLDSSVLRKLDVLTVVYNINGKERKIEISMIEDEARNISAYEHEAKIWEYVRKEITNKITELLISGIADKMIK
jgi:exosome complex RNA-binding protein Csl4